MRWVRAYKPPEGQNNLYKLALIVTFGGNLLLAVSKAIVAKISGSAAIYADAANSISDVVYSLLMVVGLTMAIRPPDHSHPQGHSRFEPLIGLVVTASMFFAGFEAARNAWIRYAAGGEMVKLDLPALVLLVSAAIKAGMFVSISRIAKKLLSPTLTTTAKDNLSDVLTSIAAFLGVLGSSFIHPLADPIAGFLVAIWIFKQAFMAGKENLGFLTGQGLKKEELDKYIRAAEEVEGVLAVHHILSDYAGPRLILDLHINVQGSKTLNETHEISDKVTERLEKFPEVDRVYVHVEPENFSE